MSPRCGPTSRHGTGSWPRRRWAPTRSSRPGRSPTRPRAGRARRIVALWHRTARWAPRCCCTGCVPGRSCGDMPPGARSRRTLDRPTLAAFTGALQRAAAGMRLSHVVIDPEVEPGPVQEWLQRARLAAHPGHPDRPHPAHRPHPTGGGAVVRPALERPLVGQQGPPDGSHRRGCRCGRPGRVRRAVPRDGAPGRLRGERGVPRDVTRRSTAAGSAGCCWHATRMARPWRP